MPKDHFSGHCQNCGGVLEIERIGCPGCGLALEGKIRLPRLARLTPEEREFIEIFVLAAGSLKEAGRVLDLSYPTVRNRLDSVIDSLRALDRERQSERLAIIRQLEQKEIDAEQAARLLAALE